MCGVFGFVSWGGKLCVERLQTIARVTMTRGAHAWGMAWLDSRGRLKMFKQTGRIVDSLGLLAMASDARILIGHCRFATAGDPGENANNHPHPVDGGWLVHNGVIRNYDSVVQRFGLHPSTDCDSEVLGLLIEQAQGTMAERCLDAVMSVEESPLVLLGLWKPGRLVAVRQGNPLHVGRTKKAWYLASLAEGLPGNVEALPNQAVHIFTEKAVDEMKF